MGRKQVADPRDGSVSVDVEFSVDDHRSRGDCGSANKRVPRLVLRPLDSGVNDRAGKGTCDDLDVPDGTVAALDTYIRWHLAGLQGERHGGDAGGTRVRAIYPIAEDRRDYGPGSFRPEAGTERCNLSVPNLSFFPDRIAPVAI